MKLQLAPNLLWQYIRTNFNFSFHQALTQKKEKQRHLMSNAEIPASVLAPLYLHLRSHAIKLQQMESGGGEYSISSAERQASSVACSHGALSIQSGII